MKGWPEDVRQVETEVAQPSKQGFDKVNSAINNSLSALGKSLI